MTDKTTLQKLEEERDSLVKVENPGYKPILFQSRKESSKDYYDARCGTDFDEFLEFLHKVKDRNPSVYFNEDELSVYYFETDEEYKARLAQETKAIEDWTKANAAYEAYVKRNSELSVEIHKEAVRLMREERLKNAEAALVDPDYQKYLALQEVMKAKGYIK